MIYALVDNGLCTSDLVEISLTVTDQVVANPASLTACDEGNNEASFDLVSIENIVNNGTANPVNWFEDINGTISITPPYNSENTTIYAIVGNGNCSSQPVEIDLSVNTIPDASPASAELCDNGNGEASFDLDALVNVVNVGTTNNVNWFEDAEGTLPLSSPYSSESTIIYAIVDDGICNSLPVAISVTVQELPEALPTSADLCDDGNGMASFDLTTLESVINNGTANQVNFFEDQNATIPVTSPFNTSSTTIYAVVGNGDCISESVEINLNVTEAPKTVATATDLYDDGSRISSFNYTTLACVVNN